MAQHSTIEWTEATWNPITGCSVVSPGCTNCYAMTLAGGRLKNHPSRAGLTRDSKAGPVWTGEVRFNKDWIDQPLRWKRPRMIFVCAHADLFHDNVPDEWIDQVFAVMALAPHHTFQVLTKRSKRMREYLAYERRPNQIARAAVDLFRNRMLPSNMPLDDRWPVRSIGDIDLPDDITMNVWPLPNVWLGVSVEDQTRADERIPDLLATPAAVRWISAEPLLGPVRIDRITEAAGDVGWHIDALAGDAWDAVNGALTLEYNDRFGAARIDWVVAGGESGPGARPMHPDWARSLRDQCAVADVAFHFKQWGAFETHFDRDRDDPDWRQCDLVQRCDPEGQWLNLAGGQGFHGERVVRVSRVGKKAAGRLLDGVEHNGTPEATGPTGPQGRTAAAPGGASPHGGDIA